MVASPLCLEWLPQLVHLQQYESRTWWLHEAWASLLKTWALAEKTENVLLLQLRLQLQPLLQLQLQLQLQLLQPLLQPRLHYYLTLQNYVRDLYYRHDLCNYDNYYFKRNTYIFCWIVQISRVECLQVHLALIVLLGSQLPPIVLENLFGHDEKISEARKNVWSATLRNPEWQQLVDSQLTCNHSTLQSDHLLIIDIYRSTIIDRSISVEKFALFWINSETSQKYVWTPRMHAPIY